MSLFQKKDKVEKTDINKRFDLIGRVGQGSMSKVWRADDPISGRFAAVKLLDKEKTLRYENRFKGLNKPGEGDIALSLQHPNIVQTYEVGHTYEDEVFLVMEYVEGCGLSLLVDLQSDRMTRYRTRYMIQIGDALSYFHENKWIHRDVCPRNIMVTEDNHIKLIDFGLTVPDTADFRKPGNRTGTANYMAPELIKRQPTDLRIDVFSFSVTCFEMYTKRHPWDAALTIDAVLQHINKPPVPITDLVPRIDSQIAEAIMKGLEANPAERWQTIDEMVKEFRGAETRLVTATRKILARRKKNSPESGEPSKQAKGSPDAVAARTDTSGRSSTSDMDSAFDDLINSEISESGAQNKPERRKKRKQNAERVAVNETKAASTEDVIPDDSEHAESDDEPLSLD